MITFKKFFTFLFSGGIIILIVILINVFDIKQVDGDSMSPTLKKGDWIIINTLYNENSFFSIENRIFCGDILIFKSPIDNKLLIKRVAATEGTTINWEDSLTLSLNGELIPISPQKKYLFEDFTKVPKHAIFLLGDNRSKSVDSRIFGFVTLDRVEGKVLFRRGYEKTHQPGKQTGQNQ